jgi:hypothetical protein
MNSVRSFDKLTIYSLGDEITGEKRESLGRIEIVKDTVVAHVQEKFSTALSLLVTEMAHETLPSPVPLDSSSPTTTIRSRTRGFVPYTEQSALVRLILTASVAI